MMRNILILIAFSLLLSEVLLLDTPSVWPSYTPSKFAAALYQGCKEATNYDVASTLICMQVMYGYRAGAYDFYQFRYNLLNSLPAANVDFITGVYYYTNAKMAAGANPSLELAEIKPYFYVKNEKQLSMYFYRLASAKMYPLSDFKQLFVSESSLPYGTTISGSAVSLISATANADYTQMQNWFVGSALDGIEKSYLLCRQVFMDQVGSGTATTLRGRLTTLLNYFAYSPTKRDGYYSLPTYVRGVAI